MVYGTLIYPKKGKYVKKKKNKNKKKTKKKKKVSESLIINAC